MADRAPAGAHDSGFWNSEGLSGGSWVPVAAMNRSREALTKGRNIVLWSVLETVNGRVVVDAKDDEGLRA